MKKIAALMALVALVIWTAPSFAAKKALGEGDLDNITAAGEPKIIQLDGVTASGDVNVSFSDFGSYDLNIASESQTGLRALVLNNILGENEVANAINISSNTGSTGGAQSNTIIQSWGATKDIGAATVAGVVGGNGGNGGNGGAGGTAAAGAAAIGANGFVGKCFAPPCTSPNNDTATATATANGGAAGNGGNGGNAAQGLLAKLTMTADQIVHLANITSLEGGVNVDVEEDPLYQMNIASNSQNNLSALVVNNVLGKNLVANAINISSGVISLGDGISTPFIGASSGGGNTAQTNKICQFRGTPVGAPGYPAGSVLGSQASC
jgi:hypothetical protein